MQDRPKVSVIIPTLNREKYVASAIRSVQRQTYGNIEMIVVDVGSTDSTRDLLDRMGVPYTVSNVRGMANIRNYAVRRSSGEFFCGCDSDDMLHPKYVEETIKPMIDRRVGFVWTSSRVFGRVNYVSLAAPFFTRLSAYRFPGGQIACAMIRREAYDEVGGYDERAMLHEDSDIMIRISRRWACKAVAEPIYYYRVHGDQLVSIEGKYKTTEEYLYRSYPLHYLMMPIHSFAERVTHPRRTLKKLHNRVIERLGKRGC